MSTNMQQGWSFLRSRRWLGYFAPVSYTHLDVYKRQLMASPYPR